MPISSYQITQDYRIVTAATRPSTPYDGLAIYETDTGSFLVYSDTYNNWLPPWGTAWGVLTYGFDAGGQAASSATHVSHIQTATVDVYANRHYQFHINAPWRGSIADACIDFDILVNAGGADTVLRTFRASNAIATASNSSETVACYAHWNSTVDEPVYFWTRFGRLTGTGTLTISSATFSLVDCGPVAFP